MNAICQFTQALRTSGQHLLPEEVSQVTHQNGFSTGLIENQMPVFETPPDQTTLNSEKQALRICDGRTRQAQNKSPPEYRRTFKLGRSDT